MFHYSMVQWLFFFYFYSFCGWCFESTHVSIRTGKPVNRGFMRGPFLPLYGSGAIMMYVVSMPFQDNVLLTYFAGCIGATVLEYITSVIMDTLFDVRYWDYSYKKIQFQGRICLSSTIAWGFLTIWMTRLVHKPIEKMMLAIPPHVLGYITFFTTVFIVADFALSFKAALDLRRILVKMQGIKDEMLRMQKRLDVIIAFNNEDKEQKSLEREMKMDELTENLGRRFGSIKEAIQNAPENVRDEIAELRARYNLYMENRRTYKEMLDFYERDMIRNNPDMVSHKFKAAFEDLKNMVMDKMSK